MIRLFSLLLLSTFVYQKLAAQISPATDRNTFYMDFQLGSPLFWGDLRSTGDQLRMGYGGGLSLGYAPTNWFAAEVGANYMWGRLGAAEWQLQDQIDDQGVIRYTQGGHLLKDVYSKTQLLQFGLRLPIQPQRLMGGNGRLQTEVAPHIYINNFSPGIYAVESNKKLIDGTSPRAWSYSIGGDLGLIYKVTEQTSLFLRSSLSWIADERFEGVTTHPAWRENLMLYSAVGLRLNVGKKRKIKQKDMQPIPQLTEEKQTLPTKRIETAEVKPIQEQQTVAVEVEKVTEPVAADHWVAPIYFNKNEVTINEKRYAALLQNMLQLATKYSELPIVIDAWTDTQGSATLNERLAKQRAQALADYLRAQGIPQTRIRINARGEDRLHGDSPESRRVELRFRIHP